MRGTVIDIDGALRFANDLRSENEHPGLSYRTGTIAETLIRAAWARARAVEANVDRIDDGAGGCRVCGAEEWMWCDRVAHWQRADQDPGDESDVKPPPIPPEPDSAWDCPQIGVGGRHSEAYYDDSACAWCGARREAAA